MGVVGGTTSRLTGGNFANGAVSGAFVHMFNAEAIKQIQLGEKSVQALKKIANIVDVGDKLKVVMSAGFIGQIFFKNNSLQVAYQTTTQADFELLSNTLLSIDIIKQNRINQIIMYRQLNTSRNERFFWNNYRQRISK